MNKTRLYIVLALILGLFLGFLFFGNKDSTPVRAHNHISESSEVIEKWTCSMHPQIVKNEPGDCPICGMELIPLTTDNDGLTAQQFKLTNHAAALANIETTIISKGNTSAALRLSGRIKENADAFAIQPAHFNGRIEHLYVTSVGQKVTRGQLVASVYSPELISAQQELITAYKLRDEQPELYKAVRGKFNNWMLDGKQLQEVERTGNVITKFNLYAHVSGTVTEINVNEGDHIMDGKAIFKVANLNSVWAVFDAYENQIRNIRVGQELTITSQAYPNQKIKSKISYIDPVFNEESRTVEVRTVLNNSDKNFKPGMFVEGQLIVVQSKDQNYVSVPESSVLWTGTRSVVYLKVNKEVPVFEMREITLGEKLNNTYQVIDGLKYGDEVVTHGTFTLDAAAQLQGKASMMNRSEINSINNLNDEDNQAFKNKRIKVSDALKDNMSEALEFYMALKDALVEDNDMLAKAEAEHMKQSLSVIKLEHIETTEKKTSELKVTYEMLLNDLEQMLKSESLKAVRLHFVDVSLNMINLIEYFGVNKKVYVQFCPMANTNSGAFWLSFNQKIRNPYFGSKMLECGENDKIIE